MQAAAAYVQEQMVADSKKESGVVQAPTADQPSQVVEAISWKWDILRPVKAS